MLSSRSARAAQEEEGQATLEYVLVIAGVAAMLAALFALVKAGENGVLARLASWHASHGVEASNVLGGLFDALMY